MHYDRTVIAYHGCEAETAEKLLQGEAFKPSANDYDWLGAGIYFWEYGADRAFQFAKTQQQRGKIKEPAYIGALIQLGNCFDLMDTRFTTNVSEAYPTWKMMMDREGVALPQNEGPAPDHKKRKLDCAVLNWYLSLAAQQGSSYDTVRCGFVEGGEIFPGSAIRMQSHVQLAVRNPGCIIGVFRPKLENR